MTKLPNFLCVGAQKAGTTTLHDILKQHPDIYLPKLKESHFFDQAERYEKGISWWMETFFSDYKDEKIMGVVTPEYLYYEGVPSRIAKHLETDVKILIILRNPVDRAYSHYLMSKRRGFEKLGFGEAILQEHSRINEEFGRNHFSYVDRGLYYKQVKRYYDTFDKNNILLLSFEDDLIKNRLATIERIQVFLGVDIRPLSVDVRSNAASEARFSFVNRMLRSQTVIRKLLKVVVRSYVFRLKVVQFIDNMNQKAAPKESIPAEIARKIMKEYFVDDIKNLERLTDRKFDSWSKI